MLFYDDDTLVFQYSVNIIVFGFQSYLITVLFDTFKLILAESHNMNTFFRQKLFDNTFDILLRSILLSKIEISLEHN